MSPLRSLAASVVVVVAVLSGCTEEASANGKKPSRFDAPSRDNAKVSSSFCEVSFPGGEGGRAWIEPAEKALPVAAPASTSSHGWKWVNLWATWCHPCVEEMGLLGRWQKALAKDGIAVDLELWSIDDDANDLRGWLSKTAMPGRVRWLKNGTADTQAVFAALGIDKGSAIPVHALIDRDNHVRCVRVGNVHDEDYGAIKALLSGG